MKRARAKDDARRIACLEPCDLETPAPLRAVVWNVSVRGIYVALSPPLEIGTKVFVTFSLPQDEGAIRAEMQVAWQNPPSGAKGCGNRAFNLPPGCGLEFVTIDPDDLKRIEAHVDMTPVSRTDKSRRSEGGS